MNKSRSRLLSLVFLGFLICPVLLQAQNPNVEARLGYPELIIYNGKIVTMDDDSFSSDPGSIFEAMAVRNHEILALGNNAEVRELAGPAA